MISISRRYLPVLLLVCQQAAADAYIFSFDGLDAAYQIRRGEAFVPVSVYEPLADGDQVVVRTRRNKLIVRYAGGPDVEVTAGNSPYRVITTGKSSTEFSNLLYWAKNTLKEFVGDEDLSRVNMVTRSRPSGRTQMLFPRVPLSIVPTDVQQLLFMVDGGRDDTLQVMDSSDALLPVQTREGNLYSVKLDATTLFPLRLVVADTSHEVYLAENVAPECPHKDMDMQEACFLWLAKQDQGQWELLALTRLHELKTPLGDYLIKVLAHTAR